MLNLLIGLLIAWMAIFAWFDGHPPSSALVIAFSLTSYVSGMVWLFRR
jgi:hypothetical protein